MTVEEIIEEYGEVVLDTYYSIFPDKDASKFGDRCCGFVGDIHAWATDCYFGSGSD